jgi:uncharacterized membrane protein YccC
LLAARTSLTAALDRAHQAVDAIRAGASGASPTDVRLLALAHSAEMLQAHAIAVAELLQAAACTPAWATLGAPLTAMVASLATALRGMATLAADPKARVDCAPVEQARTALEAKLQQALPAAAPDPNRYRALGPAAEAADALGLFAAHLEGALEAVRQVDRGGRPPEQILRGDAPPPRLSWWERLRAQLTLESLTFRHALRLAVAVVIGITVYTLFAIPHGFWITLTLVAILKPNFGATLDSTLQRVAGTVLGAILAALVLAVVPSQLWLYAALILLAGLTFALKPLSYVLFVMMLTPLVIVLLDITGAGNWTLAALRVGDTVIGGVIAVLAIHLLWPLWETTRLPQQLATTLRANRAYFLAVAAALQGRPPPASGDVASARRQALLENGNAAVSFQRLLGEPAGRRGSTRVWHLLVTGNQQLFETITSLDLHRTHRHAALALPAFDAFVEQIGAALEALAQAVAAGTAPTSLPGIDTTIVDLQDQLARLETTHLADLGPPAAPTPARAAALDLGRIDMEARLIHREVGGMHLALQGA